MDMVRYIRVLVVKSASPTNYLGIRRVPIRPKPFVIMPVWRNWQTRGIQNPSVSFPYVFRTIAGNVRFFVVVGLRFAGLKSSRTKGDSIMRKRRTFSDLVDVNVRELQYSSEIDFDGYVTKFLSYSTSKGLSKDTVKYYEQKLSIWKSVLEEIGITTDVQRCTREVIEQFSAHLVNERGWKYVSVKTALRAVKAFYNFLRSKERIIDSHGFDDFTITSPETSEVETFSSEELVRLLSLPDPKLFIGVRNYTIMLTFLEIGIRLRELCDLRLADVDFRDSVLKVLGKNGSVRYVPFQTKYAKVLRQYLKVRGESPSDSLFITQDDGKMSRRSVQQFLRRYGKQANLSHKRVSPHTFRHTFAKMYIQNGGDPFSLQQILGHSTMDMVKVYVNMFGKELHEAHRKFSPLNNLFR